MRNIENTPIGIGKEFGDGLRSASRYDETQRRMENSDSLTGLLDSTPPVGLNLRLISEMKTIPELAETIQGKPQTTTILGLAIVDGVKDFQKFVNSSLRAPLDSITIVDIDNTILEEVNMLELPNITTIWKDARNTDLPDTSQDIVLRDHLGNCCPPFIDREIDKEVSRITKPQGLSFVNITTSDIILLSPHRVVVPFHELQEIVGQTGVEGLQTKFFNLSELKRACGDSLECLRGKLLEIETEDSFVIFGEDVDGHGEWFRSWKNHTDQWKQNGFRILEVREREGNDSHEPPLRCHRHNVILIKEEEGI